MPGAADNSSVAQPHPQYCIHSIHDPTKRMVTLYPTYTIALAGYMSHPNDPTHWLEIYRLCFFAGFGLNNKNEGIVHTIGHDGKVARISFRPPNPLNPDGSIVELNKESKKALAAVTDSNCTRALEALGSALKYAQEHGICCEHFTYFCRRSQGVKLCNISIADVREMVDLYMELKVDSMPPKRRTPRRKLSLVINLILAELPSLSHGENRVHDSEKELMLAVPIVVQFLLLAFHTYASTKLVRVEPMIPTKIQRVHLHGIESVRKTQPTMSASVITLSYLHPMWGHPVLVFDDGSYSGPDRSCELLATPTNIVDTWGAALLATTQVGNFNPEDLCAMVLHRAVLVPTDDVDAGRKVVIWIPNTPTHRRCPVRFKVDEELCIVRLHDLCVRIIEEMAGYKIDETERHNVKPDSPERRNVTLDPGPDLESMLTLRVMHEAIKEEVEEQLLEGT